MINLELLRRGVNRIIYRRSFYKEHRLFKSGRPPKLMKER